MTPIFKNISLIYLGGFLAAFIVGPLSFFFHLYTGLYSNILDGFIGMENIYNAVPLSFYLVEMFAIASLLTSLVFSLMYEMFRYFTKKKIKNSLLAISSGLFSSLFFVFIEVGGLLKAYL